MKGTTKLILSSEDWFSYKEITNLKKSCGKDGETRIRDIDTSAKKSDHVKITKSVAKYFFSITGVELYPLTPINIKIPDIVEKLYELVVVKIPRESPRNKGQITLPRMHKFHSNHFISSLTSEDVIKHEGILRKQAYTNVIKRLSTNHAEIPSEFLNDMDVKSNQGFYYLAVVYCSSMTLNDEGEETNPCLSARFITDNILIKEEIQGLKKTISYYDFYKKDFYSRNIEEEFKELKEDDSSCIVDRMSGSYLLQPGAFFEIYINLYNGNITNHPINYFYAIARIEATDYKMIEHSGDSLRDKYLALGLREIGFNSFIVGGIEVPHYVLRGTKAQIDKKIRYLKYFSKWIN